MNVKAGEFRSKKKQKSQTSSWAPGVEAPLSTPEFGFVERAAELPPAPVQQQQPMPCAMAGCDFYGVPSKYGTYCSVCLVAVKVGLVVASLAVANSFVDTLRRRDSSLQANRSWISTLRLQRRQLKRRRAPSSKSIERRKPQGKLPKPPRPQKRRWPQKPRSTPLLYVAAPSRCVAVTHPCGTAGVVEATKQRNAAGFEFLGRLPQSSGYVARVLSKRE